MKILLPLLLIPFSAMVAGAAPLRIVCFGDSITGHRPGEDYRGRYLKWSDLLQFLIGGRLGLDRAVVVNSGWAGDRTTPKPSEGWPGAVGRLQRDLLDHRPDIAVILIGGNDLDATEAQRATTRENLEHIVRAAREAGVRVLLLQYHRPITAPGNEARGWKQLAAKNPMIAEVARTFDAPTLDMGPAIEAAARQYPAEEVVNPTDGVHLNPRGETAYARAIYKKSEELGWIGRR